jgi:ribonuclease HI
MDRQISFLGTSLKRKKTSQKKVSAKNDKITMYTDGASRGNPGASGAGVFATRGDEVVLKNGYYLGKKTNNQAEYLALLIGLCLLKGKVGSGDFKTVSIAICADSELMVRQMKGVYKVKNPVIMKIKGAIDSILEGVTCTFRHVLREKNKDADELANIGVDKKRKIPQYVTDFFLKHDIEM